MEAHRSIPTLEGLEDTAHGRGAIWARRAFLLALAAFVLAGLLGLLGVHTTTTSSASGGWTVSVRHASIARAGLDVPWQVTVRHPGGFGDEVTLAVTGSYFDIFETQGFSPAATEETRDADTWYLTFTAPPGETFVVSYDAYIQPAAQRGQAGTVTVLDGGPEAAAVATVDFRTRLLP